MAIRYTTTESERKRKRKERQSVPDPPEERFVGEPGPVKSDYSRVFEEPEEEVQPEEEEEEESTQRVARAAVRIQKDRPATTVPSPSGTPLATAGVGPLAVPSPPEYESEGAARVRGAYEELVAGTRRMGLQPGQRISVGLEEGKEAAALERARARIAQFNLPPTQRRASITIAGPRDDVTIGGEAAAFGRGGYSPETGFALRIARAAYDAGFRTDLRREQLGDVSMRDLTDRQTRESHESADRYERQKGIDNRAKELQKQVADVDGRFVTNKTATAMAESEARIQDQSRAIVEARAERMAFDEAGGRALTELATKVVGEPGARDVVREAIDDLGRMEFGVEGTEAQKTLALEAQEAARQRRIAGVSDKVLKARQRIADRTEETLRDRFGNVLPGGTPDPEVLRERRRAEASQRAVDAATEEKQKLIDAQRNFDRESRRQVERLHDMRGMVDRGEISREQYQLALASHRVSMNNRQRTLDYLRDTADREDKQREDRNIARTKAAREASLADSKTDAKDQDRLQKIKDDIAEEGRTNKEIAKRRKKEIKDRKAAAAKAVEERKAAAKLLREGKPTKPLAPDEKWLVYGAELLFGKTLNKFQIPEDFTPEGKEVEDVSASTRREVLRDIHVKYWNTLLEAKVEPDTIRQRWNILMERGRRQLREDWEIVGPKVSVDKLIEALKGETYATAKETYAEGMEHLLTHGSKAERTRLIEAIDALPRGTP